MYTAAFWKDVFERAIATLAQTILALAGVNATGWTELNWVSIFITGAIAAGLSVLKSLATSLVGNPVPTVVKYEYETPPVVDVEDNR